MLLSVKTTFCVSVLISKTESDVELATHTSMKSKFATKELVLLADLPTDNASTEPHHGETLMGWTPR